MTDFIPTPLPGIPSRHGANIVAARAEVQKFKVFIKGDPEPDAAQWAAIGDSLLQGDPPMDRLAAWMMETGMGSTKKLFDQAVTNGIASLPDAPAPMREFFEYVERRPDWVDADLIAKGAQATGIGGSVGMDAMRNLGLLAGYRAAAINQTLVATGALEKGPQKRLAETTQWWIDCTRPGGMEPFAAGYRSTLQVRLVHSLVRRHVGKRPDWNTARDGVPVSQNDMHATYLAFSVIFIVGQRVMGVLLKKDEREAIMALWRYIAWVMGVDAKWLHASENDAMIGLYQNLIAQAGPDETSRQLGAPLADEPLGHHYPRFEKLRTRWDRARHLSIGRAFIGKTAMAELGQPSGILPWYPLLSGPPRFAFHCITRLIPGGRNWLMRRGHRQQQAVMDSISNSVRHTEFAKHVATLDEAPAG